MSSSSLVLYNTLSRKKENFIPLNPPFVGMYVCGPTVYSETHLGHSRPAIIFDVLSRYLRFQGYKVRYVRNVTDVGHLEDEVAGSGEDRLAKKARLEQIEPMEVAQRYIINYRTNMQILNVLPPSIEPFASGHIIEQQELVKTILNNGYAYESDGSVYFDVLKYNQDFRYGKLSGRVLDELMSETRELAGQEQKKNSFDFALWKKADAGHIMRWPSEWSEGFPGWHLECSAMSKKYLGEVFDIHGGGMDLMFPHHECEIAQSVAAQGKDSVRYWMHNNMITINGQKMARSLGNFITLQQLFSGDHPLLEQAYSPMTIRFFVLQAHYRGTLDFSNEALKAAEKGLARLIEGMKKIPRIKASASSSFDIQAFRQRCFDALNDDLNTPILLAELFEGIRFINSCQEGRESLTESDKSQLEKTFHECVFDIMGLQEEQESGKSAGVIKGLVELVLTLRKEARARKDFATSDLIRDQLNSIGVEVKDTKDGTEWKVK